MVGAHECYAMYMMQAEDFILLVGLLIIPQGRCDWAGASPNEILLHFKLLLSNPFLLSQEPSAAKLADK